MLSYNVTKFGQRLEPANQPDPVPQGSEVLLRVTNCGVCHSDLHLWDGYFDLGGGKKLPVGGGEGALPMTLGHEITGEVIALGPDASGVAIGDKRVVFPWIGCGTCAYCLRGDEHICNKPRALGINRPGGYADRVLVPHGRYLLDYSGLPPELACTFACSGLTAYSALKKIGKLAADEPLLIIGAGGVGLAGVRLAKAVCGVAPIVADINDAKLEAAKAAGAAAVINSSAADAGKQLFKLTGGVIGAVDFVGADSSANFGQAGLRKGGKLVIVGLFGGTFSIPVAMFPMRSMTISGSFVGSLAEMHELLELGKKGLVAPIPVRQRPLADAADTLADLKAGKIVGRVVLAP